MAEIILNCPQCQRLVRVTEELVGRPVQCPVCGLIFSVPAGGSEPQPGTLTRERAQTPISGTPPAPQREGGTEDAEDEERPWVESRQFHGRRDAEPHRGTLVLVLGIISIVMSTLGACSVGAAGLIALPFGIAAWLMGRGDLKKMRENLMDGQGSGLTQAGMICGVVGTVLGALCSLAFLIYLGFVFTMLGNLRNLPRNPGPAPAPVPIRPVQPPPPRPPGNRAVRHDRPEPGGARSSVQPVL